MLATDGATIEPPSPQNGPPMTTPLDLTVLPDELTVCRLPAEYDVPGWVPFSGLRSVTWTADETSVVCASPAVPEGTPCERGWRALMIAGPLDFALTGILASVADPLAAAGISIFAISTYDTDYVLVRERDLGRAAAALREAGHTVAGA
jgi:uncharacterized protein